MIKVKAFGPSVVFAAGLASASMLFSGCGTTMTGAVKEDVTLTGQTRELERAGSLYRGPEYTVALIQFDNRTPSKTIGIGEAATDILRTIVKQSGLEPMVLTKEEIKQQERIIELQQTGAVKKGRKDAAEGFESLDYRVSGAVTHYSEIEESSDSIVYQSKTHIARVQVDFALVDVATGKTLLSESGVGEYRKKTGGAFGLGGKSTADPVLRDGALRDALTKAMTKMADKLNTIPFRGRVLETEGKSVVIKAGTRSRLEPGAVLGVYRPGADLVDPDTGRVIGKREKQIGEIIIREHSNERISEASVKAGSGFQPGDIVKELK